MIISPTWKLGVRIFCALVLGLGLLSAWGLAEEDQEDLFDFSKEVASTNAAYRTECAEQLKRISQAIKEYRKQHGGALPAKLSDLVVERFITEREILLCPYARQTGKIKGYRYPFRQEVFFDQQTYYTIEFSTKPLQLFDDLTTTPREWKDRQAAYLNSKKPGAGDDFVPLIRCLGHSPVLNLSRGGRIYESDPSWEQTAVKELDGLVTSEELGEEFLFAKELARKRKEVSFPPRNPSCPAKMVDLSRLYNARLVYAWQPWHVGNDLSQLGLGVIDLKGRSYDIRGVVQLGGKQEWGFYPRSVEPILINQKASAIHFIHATSHSQATNTVVGHYLIRYSGGATSRLDLEYGRDLADWWHDQAAPDSSTPSKAEVVWSGTNSAVDLQNSNDRRTQPLQKKIIRLYRTEWRNPNPEIEIASIDFVSAMSDAAPFLIAISLE